MNIAQMVSAFDCPLPGVLIFSSRMLLFVYELPWHTYWWCCVILGLFCGFPASGASCASVLGHLR